MDYRDLAIADIIKHPEYGIGIFSPAINDPISDNIYVRFPDGERIMVKASECIEPTNEEYNKMRWNL
jgi:hypothetical protein